MAAPRILIVKRDKIGDMLLTTPLLAHLRKQLPQSRIDVLCTDYNGWVLEGNRYTDERFELPRIRVGTTLRLGKIPANIALRSKLALAHYDVALVFSTKYEPPHPLLDRWETWVRLKRQFFGYERDLPPSVAAQMLGGQIVFSEQRKGQWAAVIELKHEEIMNAEASRNF